MGTETNHLSITKDMRDFLYGKDVQESYPALKYDNTNGDLLDSIHSLAFDDGLKLDDWVRHDPDRAILNAQLVLRNWENVRTNLALSGRVNNEIASREMVSMVTKGCEDAKADLEHVLLLAASSRGDEDQFRKDRLIKTLYERALKGDTRSIQYFIDRVEGKIPDARLIETDYKSAGLVYAIVHSLFERQLEVLNSGYGTRICCCSRRAGKSHLIAATLLIDALSTTNCLNMYIGETAKLAEGILDKAMQEIVTNCDLRDSKGNRLNWRKLENGSEILVRGLSNTKDPDQIRGHKCKTIAVDEFFHLKDHLLEYMITEVLEPMQLDYADNYRLLFIGTPPKTKGTYGEKAWDRLKVPHFTWTWEDNPYIKNGEQYIEEKAAEKGLDLSSPEIQREYYAKWVYDQDVVLYPDFHVWTPDTPPRFNIDKIYVGIDYGIHDNDAIIGVAWDTAQRRGFEFFESKFNRLNRPSSMSQFEYLKGEIVQCWEYALDFWPGLDKKESNKKIVWVADTNESHVTEDMQYNTHCRYSEIALNMGAAHKHDSILMQDKIKDLLRTGNLLLMDGGIAVQECQLTVLKRDPAGNITLQIDDKVYHPDILHALRYALWEAIGLEILSNGKSLQQDNSQFVRVPEADDYLRGMV